MIDSLSFRIPYVHVSFIFAILALTNLYVALYFIADDNEPTDHSACETLRDTRKDTLKLHLILGKVYWCRTTSCARHWRKPPEGLSTVIYEALVTLLCVSLWFLADDLTG